MQLKEPIRIKQFVNKWNRECSEKQEARDYWAELIEILLGVNHGREYCEWEKPVKLIVNKKGKPSTSTKSIDVYLQPSMCVVEHKSSSVSLDDKLSHGDTELTAYEQAKLYYDNLNQQEQGRYTITCNFKEIRVYDNNAKIDAPQIIKLTELPRRWRYLRGIVRGENYDRKQQDEEQDASAKTASKVVKELYSLLKSQYKKAELTSEVYHQLNVFCVRVVFCLYADDSGVFDNEQFKTFLQKFPASDLQEKFKWLFDTLNKKTGRAEELDQVIKEFDYVNGGLFAQQVEIPRISEKVRKKILDSMDGLVMPGKDRKPFRWGQISPTNFGCIFESTLDPQTRHDNGMHYTTPANIHRVIDPLFLDELTYELECILSSPTETKSDQEKRYNALREFQSKLLSMRFLDPACGSGNFLTETYKSIKRLEMRAIAELPYYGDPFLLREPDGTYLKSPCKVSIAQFFGIEINDFASQVALAALWISECQMVEEQEEMFNIAIKALPLQTNTNITRADALTIDWKDVFKPKELNYIIGNPPFEGSKKLSDEQKHSVKVAMSTKDANGKSIWNKFGTMDFVCAWYAKAAEYMKNTATAKKKFQTAFVSTNSIAQGEQVSLLWKPLVEHYNIAIQFAWRSFVWENSSKDGAAVHCVIIAFRKKKQKEDVCRIFSEGNDVIECKQINSYLLPAEHLFIENRTTPLADVPVIGIGNKPIDDGNYLFTEEEKDEFITEEPKSKQFFKPWYGADEFLKGTKRYCLWLGDCTPAELDAMPLCKKRVLNVIEYRKKSESKPTRELALKPRRFHVENMPKADFLIIPKVSSENRMYIPMGIMSPDNLCSDLVFVMPDSSLYHFGVLQSRIHMAWVKIVCGRMKSDFRYSGKVVYNNFPWPHPTDDQIKDISEKAQSILDVRNNESNKDSSLAQLYKISCMPDDLVDAHKANDKAVFKAYEYLGLKDSMTDEEIALALLRESIKLSAQLEKKKKIVKRKKKNNLS